MEQDNYGLEQENETVSSVEEVIDETVLTPVAEQEETAELAEETAEEPAAEHEDTETAEQIVVEAHKTEKKPMKVWQMVLAIAGSALVLMALAVLLLYGMGFEIVKTPAPTDAPQISTGDETPTEDTPYVAANDYTDTLEQFNAAGDTVVATVGGKELTNKKLQIFFNIVVNDFVMSYYSYLSEVGLDYTKPLNEQKCTFEEDCSWEEYFVDAAIQTWVNYQSVALLAEEANYQLPADVKEALEKMPEDLEEQAKSSGYESAEAMVQDYMHCSMQEYTEYWTLYQIGASFTGEEPAREELEKYFEENKETFEESGITKDSGPIVDVRHILISPEGGTTDETTGETVYNDAEWEACKKSAEKILQEWKDGEATEDSFATLANEKSTDPGSNTNGGLYEGITKETSFVEPFLNWCIDESRKVGDTGLVKTDYGYHIMYMSAKDDYWAYEATMSYISDMTTKLIEQAKEKWPAEIDMSKVCLVEIEFA